MVRTFARIFALTLIFVAELSAQASLRVAVGVTEPEGSGAIASVLSAALRSLGDIEVVTVREESDYTISLVAICDSRNDSCDNFSQYAVSITLAEPFDETDAIIAIQMSQEGPLKLTTDRITNVREAFRRYTKIHGTWVALWGRNRYEQALRQMVAEIDSTCFERTRITRRFLREHPNEPYSALSAVLAGKDWQC